MKPLFLLAVAALLAGCAGLDLEPRDARVAREHRACPIGKCKHQTTTTHTAQAQYENHN